MDYEKIAAGMVEATRGFVQRSLAPRDIRLKALEARHESTDELLADLEARIAALERK